jgi:uncharacterized protein (TIGR02646 family)
VRQIVKQQEPPSLTAHRQTPYSTYNNYAAKDELRNALVAEQGAICCYCMGRIQPDWGFMKVEHWRSQTNYPGEQLDYQNLLGGCKGGEGQPQDLQHCDTHKKNADLRWNPANPAHHVETRITYTLDGTICADDGAFDDQLNIVLNLNLPHIKNNRKSALTGLLEWWKAEKNRLHRPPPRDRIERKLEQHTKGTGSLLPYCQVAVWWLRRKLAEMP